MTVSILPAPLPDSREILRILPLTDLHLGVKPSATALLLADTEYLQSMDYIVLLGDQAAAWGTDEEYSAVDEFVRQLPRPYAAINGNHEFFFEVVPDSTVPAGRVFNQASPDFKSERLEKFRTFFGYPALWSARRTPLGLFLFLCLDDVNHPRPEALSAAQLQFLEDNLRDAANQPVYIFCHAPLSLGQKLDMTYYDETRTACVELSGALRELCAAREAPLLWISGHVHLRPDHYLYPAYQLAPHIWQVHCPDATGYSRWAREQVKPEFHEELYSRHLEIGPHGVELVTRDHAARSDVMRERVRRAGV